MITKAFNLANSAHDKMRRKSGEPYILHPIAVAKIATTEIGLGTNSIVSALLHDVVEDTDFTVDDIRMQFGEQVANIVDGLTKIAGVFEICARSTACRPTNSSKYRARRFTYTHRLPTDSAYIRLKPNSKTCV